MIAGTPRQRRRIHKSETPRTGCPQLFELVVIRVQLERDPSSSVACRDRLTPKLAMMSCRSDCGDHEILIAAYRRLNPVGQELPGPHEPERERFVTNELGGCSVAANHRLEVVAALAEIMDKRSQSDDASKAILP